MRPLLAAATLTAVLAAPATGQSMPLQPALAGLGFLLGSWGSGTGKVAETGGASIGTSIFTPEVNGGLILRRDHTELRDASGTATGEFDQIMIIYGEGGVVHGDYADGTHIIHYVSATVDPGHSVTFASAGQPGAPVFRLAYSLSGPQTLSVSFGMVPPVGAFRPIATGTLTRTK